MRSNRIAVCVGALVLLMAGSPVAWAQGGRGGGMFGGPLAGLRVLTTPEGEKELNITADQRAKLADLVDNFRTSQRERMQSIREELGEGASREEFMEKMQSVQRELASNVRKDLKEVLDETQLKRFEQINLQAMGVQAYSDPEVQEKLKLTAEQKSKLQDVQRELQTAMMEAGQQNQGDREGMMTAMREAREAAQKKVDALLTSEQKQTWTDMTGKPFQMPPFQPGGGRRRVN